MSITANFSKILAKLDRVTVAAKKAARPAAQAGAEVYQQQAKRNAPVSKKPHSTKGKKQTFKPGNYRDAIYQAHMPEESGEGHHEYRVSFNKKKAFYGNFLERGTSKMPARAPIRRAYEAAKETADATASNVLQQEIAKELR